MEYIHQMWCAHIEISAACPNNCVYCTRYTRHLRPDQRVHMPVDKIEAALIAYQDWPKQVGFIGGEPLMHPQLLEIVDLAHKYLPQKQLHFFSTGLPGVKLQVEESNEAESHPPFVWVANDSNKHDYYRALGEKMSQTFRSVHYHAHTEEQKSTCKHHPLTVAVREVVQDEGLMWKLINNCWLQRRWSATVNTHGAYLCEVGAALDKLLYNGAHAWEVVPGWWKRAPHEFQEQISKLCPHCGMCVPMETQLIGDENELFSPELFTRFKDNGLQAMKKQVRISNFRANAQELAVIGKGWKPGNYREGVNDIYGLYFALEPNLASQAAFSVDTEEDFAASLEKAKKAKLIPAPGRPLQRMYFHYKDKYFDPLYEQYPFVLHDNRLGNLLYYRGMLLYFRAFLDDKEFTSLCSEGFCQELLSALPLRFRALLRERRKAHLKEVAEKLGDQDVYFWGAGEALHHYKYIFKNVKPRAILVDINDAPDSIDGIPVMHADIALQQNDPLPMVVFMGEINFESIKKKIESRYAPLVKGDPIWALFDWTGPAILRGWTAEME